MSKHLVSYTLLWFIFLYSFSIQAQENEIIELEKKIKNTTNKKNKAEALNELVSILIDNNEEEKAEEKAREALKISEKAGYDAVKGRTLTHLGDIAINQQDYKKAQKYYEEAQKVLKVSKTKDAEGHAWSGIGLSLYYQSEYFKSLNGYKKALRLFEETKNIDGEAEVLNRLGATYNAQASYDEALKYYLKALELNKKRKDEHEIALNMSNIGIVYKQLKNLDKAVLYFKQALQVGENNEFPFIIGASLTNLGAVYDDLGKYKQSLSQYKKSLVIFEDLEHIAAQSAILNNMGDVYRKMENYEKALELHLKALEMKKEIGDKKGEAILYHSIAQVYFAQRDFTNAHIYWGRAVRLATKIGHRETKKDAYEGISKIFLEKGDHKQAYEYYERFTQLKDSLINAETIDKITSLRSLYNTAKEEQKIETSILKEDLVKSKNTAQFIRTLSFILSGVILLLLALLFLLYRKKSKRVDSKTNIIKEEEPKKEIDKAEIKKEGKALNIPQNTLLSDKFWQHFQESNFSKAELGIQEHCQDYFNIFAQGKPKQNFLWWFENEKAKFIVFANYLGTEIQNLLAYTWSDKILYQLIQDETLDSPAEVLSNWDIRLQTYFRRNDFDVENWEGIASTVLCWTKDEKFSIASSKKEVFYTDKNQIKSLQGLEIGIGFTEYYEAKNYENQPLNLAKGEEIFLFSENLYESLGESESIKEKLSDLQTLSKEEQKEQLNNMISETENESWILGLYL